MKRWLHLRHAQSFARGGSSSARDTHSVKCSAVDGRYAVEERLVAQGAQTFRDVRRESARRMERLLGGIERTADAAHAEISSARNLTNLQLGALVTEHKHVADRGHTREWANYLVSLRRLDDDAGDVMALNNRVD